MSEQDIKIFPVPGIRMSAVSAGIKKAGRLDVVLFELCEGATVAGVYTQNAFCAAPVQVTRDHNSAAQPRYLLINTGNANAGTGQAGVQDALHCCEKLALATGLTTQQVLPFSTGVIGEALPVEKITAVYAQALASLSEQNWTAAAQGIMTTDTVPKFSSRQISIAGNKLTVTGIAKGAGMIKPNMATMLGFIFTDAKIDKATLHEINLAHANRSFNRITVDGDTSTNDCCMLAASAQGELDYAALSDTDKAKVDAVFQDVYQDLAQAIVRDGEGASKFVTIDISEGLENSECLRLAYAVAESPLVKTALFASDPNWGRILAVVGRAGIPDLDISQVSIFLDDVCIVENGGKSPAYTEAAGQAVVSQSAFAIRIVLGRGDVSERIWTCDLSYDYVKINAEYRS